MFLNFFAPLNWDTKTSDIAVRVMIKHINAHDRVPEVTAAVSASEEYQDKKILSTNNIADIEKKFTIIGKDIFQSSLTEPV